MTHRRALVLQGNRSVRSLLRRQLTLQDFQTTDAADGTVAWALLKVRAFDVIVIDRVTSGMDMITLCRAIRGSGPNQRSAIVVVSASGEEAERVLALLSGADDYLTIPFSLPEFQSRISALMRRSQRRHVLGPRPMRDAADLTVDRDRRAACVGTTPLPLTRREFNLLYLLMNSPGTVFTREDLRARLCPGSRGSAVRSIDPLVSRLRAKLKKAYLSPRLIRTVHGAGYTFAH